MNLIAKLVYRIKAWRYGECPDCHVILIEDIDYGRYVCFKCKKHYHTGF